MSTEIGDVEMQISEAMEHTESTPPPVNKIDLTTTTTTTPTADGIGTRLKDFSLNMTELLTIISDNNYTVGFKKPLHVITKENAIAYAATAAGAGAERKKQDLILEDGFEIMDIIPPPQINNESIENNNPFVDAAIKESQKSRTENNAPTFSTSGNSRLDFFFNVLEQTNPEDIIKLLENSWNENNLDTLKIIANLRDIRGGKGIRRQYQDCLYWLYQNHPKTLYENLNELIKFGYWKDILHFLVIICFDGFIHPFLQIDDKPKTDVSKLKKKQLYERRKQCDIENRIYNKLIVKHYGLINDDKKIDSISKLDMIKLRIKYAREKFMNDIKYKIFHVKIAKIFAQQLYDDIQLYKDPIKKDKKLISLAGKWAPSLEGHFDRYTLISSTISIELANIVGRLQITKRIPVAIYLARKMYHKEYCVPLRKFHHVPEVYMSGSEWKIIKYNRVPAKCMQKNKSLFIKHDNERFENYLKRPNTKVAGASLKPVELICRIMSIETLDEMNSLIIEKQWISLAEDIKQKGSSLLSNAVAVCDVSGSMNGIPMQAAIGLTLLTMNMTEAPWNSLCITFHSDPTMHHLKDSMTLAEKVKSLTNMPWGCNTDLHKVFKQILYIGKEKNLKDEQMPKILLIFTDMEFDEACHGTNLTNFEAAKSLFEKNGFTLPSIVFWNLRSAPGKKTSPVQTNELGVIMLSGWSGQLLAQIMKQNDMTKCTGLTFLLDVLNDTKFDKLQIYD